jgi:hypothetical protein
VPSFLQSVQGSANLSAQDSYFCELFTLSVADRYYLCKLTLPEAELPALVSGLNMKPLERKQTPSFFLWIAPEWWDPQISRETQVFSTIDFPMMERGADGIHCLALWEPKQSALYLWYKSNF